MGKFDTDSGIDTTDECDMETAEVSENVDTDENTDSETNELEEYDVPAITEEIENATGSAELEEWPEPEMTLTQEEFNGILENETDTDRLRNLRDLVTGGQIGVEMEEPENLEEETEPELILGEEEFNEILENETDTDRLRNLRDLVTGGQIGVEMEEPEELEDLALEDNPIVETCEEVDEEQVEDVADVEEINENNIDYNEIYEEINRESLEQGFENVEIEEDPERLEDSLSDFEETNWENLSLDEQKASMEKLADYVTDVVGLDNPPQIEYYNNEQNGDYGGFDPATNTLRVNEYMLYNSEEAADTVAHELWHAYQQERAMNPQTARDYQYQYNFENYIPASLDQEGYQNQLIEAEARAFASQFKDKLAEMKGRQE